MRTIDKRTALRMLTKIVKADPTKEAQCIYATGPGKPECVAGVLLQNVGIDAYTVETIGGSFNNFTANNPYRGSEVEELFKDVHFTKGAARLVSFMQSVQDRRLQDAARFIFPVEQRYGSDCVGWIQAHRGDFVWADALALTVDNYSKF